MTPQEWATNYFNVLRLNCGITEPYQPSVIPRELVDHNQRLIIVDPSQMPTDINPTWQDNCLRLNGWTVIIEGWLSTETSWIAPIHETPTEYSVSVAGYVITDQPVIENKLPSHIAFGSSQTIVMYFDTLDYAKRLGQRALELWAADHVEREEKDKIKRISSLEKTVAAFKSENDALWKLYLTAIGRRDQPL